MFVRVKQITSVGEASVWDLHVPPVHNYSVCGFKVSNCGFSGSLYHLLTTVGKLPPAQARALCDMDKPFDFDQLRPKERQVKVVPEVELYPYALEGEGLTYMTQIRGVRKSALVKAGILYDSKQKRVLFPWYNGDKLIAVTGRTVDVNTEDQFKIVSYFDTTKGATLYLPGRTIKATPLVLVEGETDALKVFQLGYENVGATGQGRFTRQQENLVLNSPCTTVILFTDDDETGERLADSIHDKLSDHKLVLRVDYAKWRGPKRTRKADPAGLRPEVVRMLIQSATGKVFTTWSSLRR